MTDGGLRRTLFVVFVSSSVRGLVGGPSEARPSPPPPKKSAAGGKTLDAQISDAWQSLAGLLHGLAGRAVLNPCERLLHLNNLRVAHAPATLDDPLQLLQG